MEHLIIVRHERGRKFFVIQAAPQQVFIMFITDIIRDFTVYLSLSSASPDAAPQSAHLPLLLHSSHSSPGIREHHNPVAGRHVLAAQGHHHQMLPRPHPVLYHTLNQNPSTAIRGKAPAILFSCNKCPTKREAFSNLAEFITALKQTRYLHYPCYWH